METFKNIIWPKARAAAVAVTALLCLASCRALPPLPPTNLAEPGWTVRRGQAVWTPRRHAPEIAGDILLATHPGGRAFVQFSKSPITLAVAEKSSNEWQVDFPVQNQRYSGRGAPPTRVVWLILAGVVAGKPPPGRWIWKPQDDAEWRLQNPETGESLAGYFEP